jgi:hypothetical protein
MIGQLVIGKYCASYNVRSHTAQPPLRQCDVSAFLLAARLGRELFAEHRKATLG